jgi:hypothetical protein
MHRCDYNERFHPGSTDQRVIFPSRRHRRARFAARTTGNWLAKLFGTRAFQVTTASADASFRRYFRVARGSDTWIAMDAPPAKEDMEPYIRIASMLVDVGVNAPRVLERNDEEGFLLNSDLGSQTYLMELEGRATRIASTRMPSTRSCTSSRARRPCRAPAAYDDGCCDGKWASFRSGFAAGISA